MELIYFTVGPSKLHEKFEEFIAKGNKENIGSLSHRSPRFSELFENLSNNLKILFNVPEEYSVFYSGSATEFMERIVQNCSEKNTLHFVDGSFSRKFSEISGKQGRINTEIVAEDDGSFFLDNLPGTYEPELICLTHNETTNGVTLSPLFIESIQKRFPDKLIALDIVSSAPTSNVDFSKIDCIFFSVQKGFGLPAGLGVIFVSPRALKKAEEIEKNGKQYTGSYHSFMDLAKYASKKQTPETPNVFGMYLLNEVCLDFLNRTIEKLRSETKIKADLIYKALDGNKKLKPLVTNKELRSETVIVAKPINGSQEVIEYFKKGGFLVASGYAEQKEMQIRIANFPSHSIEQVQKLCMLIDNY